MTKSQLLSELEANKELGLAYNQSGIPLQLMPFNEFLNWYTDTGSTHYCVEEYYNDENEQDEYVLVERAAADSRKVFNRTPYATEDLANEEYYKALERQYNDDNGSGGIFYANAEAIARLEDDNDEWQIMFKKEAETIETGFVLAFKDTHKQGGSTWYFKKAFSFDFDKMEDATIFPTYLAASEYFENNPPHKMEGRYYIIDIVDGEETEILSNL